MSLILIPIFFTLCTTVVLNNDMHKKLNFIEWNKEVQNYKFIKLTNNY